MVRLVEEEKKMRKMKIKKRREAMVVDSQTEMYVMHFSIAESIAV